MINTNAMALPLWHQELGPDELAKFRCYGVDFEEIWAKVTYYEERDMIEAYNKVYSNRGYGTSIMFELKTVCRQIHAALRSQLRKNREPRRYSPR